MKIRAILVKNNNKKQAASKLQTRVSQKKHDNWLKGGRKGQF